MLSKSHGDEAAELVLQTNLKVTLKEDPAVVRARKALARRLKTQDPRLFLAVLRLAKEIQKETEQQCESILKRRDDSLSQLVATTKKLRFDFSQQLREAVTSEVGLRSIAL